MTVKATAPTSEDLSIYTQNNTVHSKFHMFLFSFDVNVFLRLIIGGVKMQAKLT